jgi:hypothetical protein
MTDEAAVQSLGPVVIVVSFLVVVVVRGSTMSAAFTFVSAVFAELRL